MSGHRMCAHPCAELRWSCGWCSGSCSLESTTSSPCLHRTSCKSSTRSHWQEKQRRATTLTLRNPTQAQQEACLCAVTLHLVWPLTSVRSPTPTVQHTPVFRSQLTWRLEWYVFGLTTTKTRGRCSRGRKKRNGCWSKLWASLELGPAVLLVRVGEGQ